MGEMIKWFPEHWTYQRWRESVRHTSDYRLSEADVDAAGGQEMFERGLGTGLGTLELIEGYVEKVNS